MNRILTFLCCMWFPCVALALPQGETGLQDSLSRVDTVVSPAERNIIPFLIYSNETSVGTGFVYNYFFPARSALKVSNVQSVLMYTLKNQLMFTVIPEYFTRDDRYKLAGVFQLSKYPNVFYGIGYEVKEEDEEDYTPYIFRFSGTVQRYISHRWKAGISLLMHYEDVRKKETGGKLATGGFVGSDPFWLFGLGGKVSYDTRDNLFMSRDGGLVELSFDVYHPWLGSDLDFRLMQLDVRRFVPLNGGKSLAFQGFFQQSWGKIPFQLLPGIGGYQLMRGFLEGKYRDESLALLQSEFRYGIWKRWGGVAFLSAGNLGARPKEYKIDQMKLAGGFGLRFRINENQTRLRLDVGVNSDGGTGFYFTIREAF